MELNFRLEKNGENLVIAVAQGWQTNEVLMVAFMNRQAVEETLKTKKAHYYSTSRSSLLQHFQRQAMAERRKLWKHSNS